MPSLLNSRRHDVAAAAAQQRLARLADEIAAVQAEYAGTGTPRVRTPRRGWPEPPLDPRLDPQLDPQLHSPRDQQLHSQRGPARDGQLEPTWEPPLGAPLERSRDPRLGPAPGQAPAAGSGRHRADAVAVRHRIGAAIGDRLPAGVQGQRVERGISGQHLAVLALVVAALIAAGAWWVLAGRPGESTAVAPVASGAPAQAAAEASPDPSAQTPDGVVGVTDQGDQTPATATSSAGPADTEAASGEVVVDVTGKVRTPGLVTLPSGSRVADALTAAGGARPGVDLTALNLARPLLDGEQILVGVDAAAWHAQPTIAGGTVSGTASGTVSGTVAGGLPATGVVDVNTATLEQLDTLPGIGPVTAQSILDWRSANGAFTSVDELLEVDGIGDVTLADIRDLVTV